MGAEHDVGRTNAAAPLTHADEPGRNLRSAVLALQRSAGNRAVQRALDDEDPTPQITGDESPEPLAGGTVTLAFTKSAPTFPAALQSSAATYNDLLAELTTKQANGQENGSTLPSTPTLTVGGKDASGMPGDEVVTSGTLTVVDAVGLPSWTNVSSAQPEQQAAWKTYVSEMTAHEDLHVADDKAAYAAAAKTMGGKTVKQAYEAMNAATDAANAQAPVTDAAHPAPTLKPAGTTKVP